MAIAFAPTLSHFLIHSLTLTLMHHRYACKTPLAGFVLTGTDVGTATACVSQDAGCSVDEAFCSAELPTKYVVI